MAQSEFVTLVLSHFVCKYLFAKDKIPSTVKVGESVYYNEPLIEYAPGCDACKAYERLGGGRGDRMKANAPKRKIFDAVDMIPVDKIKPFHDHPFYLYEGERLDDMVESIREHGVLNPVIVRKKSRGYEMLSARYEKVIRQGKRNDILRESEEIGTYEHDVHKSKSRDGIGEEYGMTGRNIARYMRVTS